jgi:hypothetical protein
MTTKTTEECTQPLAYSINELAAVSSFSRTEINRALAAGELIAKRRGTRRFILVDEAKRWLESHPDD